MAQHLMVSILKSKYNTNRCTFYEAVQSDDILFQILKITNMKVVNNLNSCADKNAFQGMRTARNSSRRGGGGWSRGYRPQQ